MRSRRYSQSRAVPLVAVAIAAVLSQYAEAGALDQKAYGQTIRADMIAKAYEKNAVAADQLYKGKVFKIGGTVKRIGSDESVTVDLEGSSGDLVSIRCTFANTAGVAALQVGRPAQITGTIDGKRGYRVLVINCTL